MCGFIARVVAAIAVCIAVVGAALAGATAAGAAPGDPFIPDPPIWCPGNDPNAFVASGYGGFCEGRTYPDGTRWNTYRVGFFWQPMRCIIPDGTAFPPLAAPGGCDGAWGG